MTFAPSHPHLALVIGAYLALSACGVLFPKTAARELIEGFRPNRALAHGTGAVSFFVGGGLMFIQRPDFSSVGNGLISLTAIWWLIEGAVALAAPQVIWAHADAAKHFYRMNLVALPAAALLLATGFIGLR